jgi:proline racemase
VTAPSGDLIVPPLRLGPTIRAVDLHASGEPGRVIVGGVEDMPGATMFDKMRWLAENRDDLRLRMLREPRGFPAANCNLVLPSSNPEAAAGYVIMEQVEYPGMSGTNTICVVTALLETGMLPMTEPLTELSLEAPAGLIRVRATCRDGKVTGVTFRNVPAFATHLDAVVEVPHLGTVTVDVAYGGMFYVIASAEAFGLRLTPDEGADIVRITEMIKAAAADQLPVVHPDQPGFAGITIGQLSGPAHDPANSMRNVVTVSTGAFDWERPASWTGAIDRSPCGTGTSARMATLHAAGRLAIGEDFRHEGSSARCSPAARRGDDGRRIGGVVPEITGQAWITGIADYVVDPTDPSRTASRSATSGRDGLTRAVAAVDRIGCREGRADRHGGAEPRGRRPSSRRKREGSRLGRGVSRGTGSPWVLVEDHMTPRGRSLARDGDGRPSGGGGGCWGKGHARRRSSRRRPRRGRGSKLRPRGDDRGPAVRRPPRPCPSGGGSLD